MLRLPLLLCVILSGCYGSPTLERSEASPGVVETPAPLPPERGGRAIVNEPTSTAQGSRLDELGGVLERLESVDPRTPKDQRPGEGLWREAELEKLLELVRGGCAAGPAACRTTLEPIAAARLPADEVWTIYAEFLQGLRPRAEEGVGVLGRDLLLRDEPAVRDRAFRIATGAGAAVRGNADALGRRASTVPTHPGLGEPVLVVLEQLAGCDVLVAEIKGPPDSAGRIDGTFGTDCPEPTQSDAKEGTIPRAPRVVWAFDAGPLPASGLELWLDGSDVPLLAVAATTPPKE